MVSRGDTSSTTAKPLEGMPSRPASHARLGGAAQSGSHKAAGDWRQPTQGGLVGFRRLNRAVRRGWLAVDGFYGCYGSLASQKFSRSVVDLI